MAKSRDIVNSSPDMSTLFRHKADLLRAGIHMYMYKGTKKYAVAVFPYTGVLSSYDLNKVRGKDAVLAYGIAMQLPTETMMLAFLFISLSGIFVFPSHETKLLSFLRMSLCMVSKLLYTKMFSIYDTTFVLGNGIVILYAGAKKMSGSFIRYDNETILTDDEVILLPNDMTLPSAEAILPSGL